MEERQDDGLGYRLVLLFDIMEHGWMWLALVDSGTNHFVARALVEEYADLRGEARFGTMTRSVSLPRGRLRSPGRSGTP